MEAYKCSCATRYFGQAESIKNGAVMYLLLSTVCECVLNGEAIELLVTLIVAGIFPR